MDTLQRVPLPFELPQKIICVGLNYRDHAEEQGTELPKAARLFAKWPNTLIGSGEAIVRPAESHQVDYEVELGVVIDHFLPRWSAPGFPGGDRGPAGAGNPLRSQRCDDAGLLDLADGLLVAEIIAYVSRTITPQPGDPIAKGTPAGVGVFRDPKVMLRDGDEVTVEVEGIGALTNPVKRES